jgi:hypothetical protein
MINKPRFRKGKKARKNCITLRRFPDTMVHQTPKQEKLYNRYLKALFRYKIKRHAQTQTAIRMALCASNAAMSAANITRIQSTQGQTPQQKAVTIAQTLINAYSGMVNALNFKLLEPA